MKLTELMFKDKNFYIKTIKSFFEKQNVNVNYKDKNGFTVLMTESCNNNKEAVQMLLLRKDLNVNAKNHDGKTACHIAIEGGNLEIADMILARSDLDINAKDRERETIFMKIVEFNLKNKIANKILKELLIYDRLDMNAKNISGLTALMLSSPSAARMLLKTDNINVNSKNVYGATALHCAVIRRCDELVSLLLKNDDINLSIKDDKGDTALSLALRYDVDNHPKIAEMLSKKYSEKMILKTNKMEKTKCWF